MNTKTTKFLAVLAVFAMAFAAVAIAADSNVKDVDATTASGVYTEETGGTIVNDFTIDDEDTTWYVESTASVPDTIQINSGYVLTIKLRSGAESSNFTVGDVTVTGSLTIVSGVNMKIDSGKTMTVAGTLTVNGVLENNKNDTTAAPAFGILVSNTSAVVTGTGTICGTAPVLIKITAGTIQNVTVSQEDWTADKTYSGKAIIYIDGVTDTNAVTIKDITVKMKEMGDEGTHGIGIYDTATGTTVTIDGAYFTTVDKNTATEEFLLYTNDKTLGNVVFKNISRDSKVLVKEGYGEYTANKTTTVGGKIKFNDSGISYLRIAESAIITGDVKVDNVILRSVNDDTPTLTISQDTTLTVNGDIKYGGTGDNKATISNSGTICNDGTTRIEGTVAIGGTGTLTNDGTLVIGAGASVYNLTNNKTVRLYGTIGKTTETTNTSKLVNEGTIYVMSEKAVIEVATKSGSGTIDTSAISKDVYLHGEVSSYDTPFRWNQTVTFDGNTTILSGAKLVFEGLAIIPEGITVTVENGAALVFDGSGSNLGKLIVNGTLIIEGLIATTDNTTADVAGLTVTAAEIENNGTIELNFDGKLPENTSTVKLVDVTTNSIFVNNGIITISEKSQMKVDTTSFVNSAEGKIYIYGDLSGTVTGDQNATTYKPILNSGIIEISSEVNSAIAISNAKVGAEIDILMTMSDVTIDDAGLKTDADKKFYNGGNEIVLTPGAICGGITITSATFAVLKGADIGTHTSLVIEGALIVSKEGTIAPADKAKLTFTSATAGRITVIDELTLTNTNLYTADANTNLYVTGTLSITKDSSFTNAGVFTVTGAALLAGDQTALGGIVNAAMYVIPATVLTDKVTVYTNVPDAIEGAAEASVKTVTVTGTVTIAESIVIPAGMKVKIEKSGTDVEGKQVVTIAKDVVVEVYSDETDFAVLENNSNIKVNGKLIFDDAKKSQKGDDTKIVSEVIVKSGNTVVYTTLAWAIADAGSEEATLTLCGDTEITTNMTIPENITVDTNGKKFKVNNAELTIDGVLFINGPTSTYTVTGDNPKIIVNGAITSESQMPYDGEKFPAGLYFSVGDKKLYYIGNIDDAEAWALVADDDKLEYWGDLETVGISFDAEATLTFKGDVTAVSMNVGSKAVVNFGGNVEIATVTMGAATINFAAGKNIDGLFVSPVGSILFSEAKADKASIIEVAVKDTVTTMTLTGSITVSEDIKSEYQVATVGDVIVKADLVELTVGTGTTTVAKDVTIILLEVYGDLVIDNTYKMTTTAAMVYGSITANAATDTKTKATAEISYLSAGVNYKDDASTSATASIEGDVTVKFAIVSADATVSASIENLPYATDVYIEGELFLTVYGYKSEDISKIEDVIDFDISDPSAKFVKWVDEDGKDVTNPKIGAPTEIYAVYNYNVYDVQIITDAGVKSVAINGIELMNGSGNVFYVPSELTAGTYKVTYTLKTGYQGDAVLSTSTGTILKDNSFVISPGSDTSAPIIFQLAGTEPIPEPEPVTPEEQSEWTITTILLVILVILIAIMAVIVALRLNRS